MNPSNRFFRILAIVSSFAILAAIPAVTRAATVFQAANSTYVAWEAEDILGIVNAAPTFWAVTNDATASGTRALYAPGANGTAAPSSFASYAIRFRTAGDYTLSFRWRADKSFTDLDPNSGNSYYRPNDFGDLSADVANYGVSAANNTRVPPDVNNYAMTAETQIYTVTQEQVDAGVPLILKLGTREAGMYIDRLVLSVNPLTEAEFNALPNSDTDIIPQGASETYVAFEAERVSRIVNAAPTFWMVTNDAPASGGQALYAPGANGTAAPSSFASYAIRFRVAGDYTLSFRWRADKSFTDLDPNSGNSYFRPNDFGDLSADVANYGVSAANNTRVPPDVNNYAVTAETQIYTVTQEQVDAGVPLILKLGTREAGMFIDRVILSQNPLTEAEFNALPNSGSVARPSLAGAVGSATLNTVRVTFDRPLAAASVIPSRFTLSGGVNVTGAALDPNTSRDVILTTSTQAEGNNYVVTVNGVTDVSGNPIAPNSTISFTSWRIASGWITRELYYNVTGLTVADLQFAPNFPNAPNAIEFVRAVSVGADLQVANFGARFRGYFVPPQAGAYEFYLFADDDALFSISANESEAGLVQVIQTFGATLSFSDSLMHTTGNLQAGQRYLFEVLYKQDTGTAALGLAARRVGTPGEIASLPLLGGNQVSTFVNPDAGAVNISAQPASATVPAGQRLRLNVSATAPLGGTLFYQWQVGGVDIPGANRPSYVTPVLTAGDTGKKYRVIVGANGTDVTSQEATVTVGPAQPSALQPYVGINFATGGGAGTTAGASLASNDVAGVALQEFWNNILGTAIDGTQALVDAQGVATPVTVSAYDAETLGPLNANIGTGTGAGNASAEHLLMAGSIANNNLPMVISLSGVPAGNYALIVYSVGFSFNSTYEEDFQLEGAASYPVQTVRGQTSTEFIANPTLVRMSGTNPDNRAHGNYVMFENVSPAPDGSFLLTVTSQSTTVGNTAYFPPVNALQLVRFSAVEVQPSLAAVRQGTGLTMSWGGDAVGFRLEASPSLGAGAVWAPAAGVPNPIAAAGSTTVQTTAATTQFYRLRK
jgi:hypothetical protein